MAPKVDICNTSEPFFDFKFMNRTDNNRRLSVDKSFFKKLDNELSCYWAGFILADGTVRDRDFSIGLSLVDIEHINRFKSDISSQHKISVSKGTRGGYGAKIYITCTEIVNDLKSHGISPRKSFDALPPIVPLDMERHLVRGYFDGDGCICVSTSGSVQLTLVGSWQTCNHFADWSDRISTCRPKIYSNGKIFRCCINRESVVADVLEEMYSGAAVSLQRKLEIAKSVVSGSPHNGRPTTGKFSKRRLRNLSQPGGTS